MLREGLFTVSEVGYKVGFSSPVYFTKCFHEHFGYPPVRIKKGDLTEWELKKLDEDNDEKKSARLFRERIGGSWTGIVILILLLGTGGY